MRISDWSSDVCSSDLQQVGGELAAELVDLGVGERLAHVGEGGAVAELADRALEHGQDRGELVGIDLRRNASGIMGQPGAFDRHAAFSPMFDCRLRPSGRDLSDSSIGSWPPQAAVPSRDSKLAVSGTTVSSRLSLA